MYDENAQDEVTITVIATGLDEVPTALPVKGQFTKDFNNRKPAPPVQPTQQRPTQQARPQQQNRPLYGGNNAAPQGTQQQAKPAFTQQQQAKPGLNRAEQPTEGQSQNQDANNQQRNVGFKQRPSSEIQINVPDFLKNRK